MRPFPSAPNGIAEPRLTFACLLYRTDSQTGLTCINKKCARLCPITTTEAYCDADSPCDATLGYTCTNSRCRPPATATRVGNGEKCNQGGLNTLFW